MLGEALALLAAAVVIVRLLPFRFAASAGARPIAKRKAGGDAMPDVRWSILAAARRLPWRSVCFDQGLALQYMLRRRGIPALLHYGVGFGPTGALAAHVWIEADGAIVLGGEEAPNYKSVAVYP